MKSLLFGTKSVMFGPYGDHIWPSLARSGSDNFKTESVRFKEYIYQTSSKNSGVKG